MRRAALLLLALLAAPAAAAPPEGKGTWSVEDSEEVRSRLEEADRLLGAGLAARGTALLQEVIDRYPDHLVRWIPEDPRKAPDPLRYEGARHHALRRIRALSPEARRAYEAAVGPRAEEALARALRLRSAEGLESVATRYLLAGSPGPRALLALADLHLARGEPGRAVAPLRTLLREFGGTPFAGPGTVARLARALGRVRDREGLEALRVSPAAAGAAEVRAGEGTVPLARVLEEAAAEAGPPRSDGGSATLGGGPARRGLGSPVEPLGPPRWTRANPRFKWTSVDIRQARNETPVSQALGAMEPLVPCIADGVAYVAWAGEANGTWAPEVWARDLYTGEERWTWRGSPVPRADSARTHGSILSAPAVKDGLVYAPLLVWPAGESSKTNWFAGQDIIPYIPSRRLFALEAGTGRVAWSHADPRPPGDPFAGPLRRLNLTSPPLVAGDLVIAAGATYSIQFTAWAVAADRRTGEIRWTTRLGYGQQEQNLFGRVVKEVPVAAVASDGERAFVQTNMGFVSCLDLATGLPVWTRGYPQTRMPYYENFWTTPEREFTWTGSPPVVSGGTVLCAPADGSDLLALDAASGEFRWAHPSRDGDSWERLTRLLGADDERAYLSGSSVRALDLRTGRLAWDWPFPQAARGEEEGSGRGLLAEGRLFVPSTRALYVLDARTSRLLRADPFPRAAGGSARAGGNLVSAEGAAVLSRLFQMEGYFSAENVQVRAAALLRERPGDPGALVEAARIYLAADRPEDAVPLFESVLAEAPGAAPADRERLGRQARSGMAEVHERRAAALLEKGDLPGARGAYARAAEIAPEDAEGAAILLRGAKALWKERLDLATGLLEAVVERRGDAVLEGDRRVLDQDIGRSTAASYALFHLGAWRSAGGDAAGALEAAQRILETRPEEDLLFSGPAREAARQFVEGILDRQGEGLYAPFEARARAALEKARAARDPAALAGVLRRWPNSRAGILAALEAGRLRLEAGDAAGALAAARGVLARKPREEEAAAGLWLLAEALARSGNAASARTILQRLGRLHPEVALETPSGRVPAGELAARRLSSPDLRVGAPEPPGLPAEGPLRTLWERDAGQSVLPRLLVPAGDSPAGRLLFTIRASTVEALDARTGTTAWGPATHPAFPGRAALAGGILVFANDDLAVGVEAATGRTVWDAPLPGLALDAAVSEGLVVLLLADKEESEAVSLWALDPASGEPAWSDATVLPDGAETIHAVPDGVLVVSMDASPPRVRMVEASDGTLRPFFVPLRRPLDLSPAEPVVTREGSLVVHRLFSLESWETRRGTRRWLWTGGEGAQASTVVAGGGVVAVLDTPGTLRALDDATGSELWTGRPGPGRAFDPSTTALLADGGTVIAVTSEPPTGARVRLEARDARTGRVLWTAPLSESSAMVEVAGAGPVLVVRFLGAGGGAGSATGVALFDRATGRVVDTLADDRLAGESFEAVPVAGVLAVSGPRVLLVRGKAPAEGK